MAVVIPENTFAAACYEQNSIQELQAALAGKPDEADCKTWGISAKKWRHEIELALRAKMADEADRLLDATGMTNADVAEALEMSERQIYNLRNGTSPLRKVVRLALERLRQR